ncbi:MAG: polymer-forming cytoskeletal protein [Thermoplasmata archaeon]|nr:polymer-forming cytoskeletal protein [Thermoplasmata archaeon]MCI4359674.1 polymer-forming cytoskeletal protein [Thermoplasmata archaeon]
MSSSPSAVPVPPVAAGPAGLAPATAPSAPAESTGGPQPPPAPSAPGRERWIQDSGATLRDWVFAERWTVQGVAKVRGKVDADSVEVHGSLSVGGDLRAGSMRMNGPLEVDGIAHVDARAVLHGAARFAQALEAADLEIDGSLRARGPLRVSGDARWTGEVVLLAEARVGRFVGSGSLEAPGAITADRFSFEVLRPSTIGTLRASSVDITRPSALPFRIPFIGTDRPTLTVLRIEASEVRLEGVSAELIQADRIVLGPDCHIARVIGEVLAVDRSSHVGPESRSPRPHGLSR